MDAEERKLPSLRKICLFKSRGNAGTEEGVFCGAALYNIARANAGLSRINSGEIRRPDFRGFLRLRGRCAPACAIMSHIV
ncbi:MAG: hypothetical protein DBY30_02465 [Verrucomicrobia bacterium]|nr:MAG: hypothetical protein DBY30_02465 [Verrucomicrobiota bacterium]